MINSDPKLTSDWLSRFIFARVAGTRTDHAHGPFIGIYIEHRRQQLAFHTGAHHAKEIALRGEQRKQHLSLWVTESTIVLQHAYVARLFVHHQTSIKHAYKITIT